MADADHDWASRTIVRFVPEPKRATMSSLSVDQPDSATTDSDGIVDRKEYKVRLADSEGRRSSASMLINKMYSWRGYDTSTAAVGENPHRITLNASEGEKVLGTLTLTFDSAHGLLADELYRAEIDAVRAQGRRVCELTKLAVDQNASSKKVLGVLFHIAYMYGRVLNSVTDVFIEVNPRHVMFYERMLGFFQIGPERTCPRVLAPAVLLRLPLEYCDEQIEKWGGRAADAATERSLYPHFFSKREEAGITGRLITID